MSAQSVHTHNHMCVHVHLFKNAGKFTLTSKIDGKVEALRCENDEEAQVGFACPASPLVHSCCCLVGCSGAAALPCDH